MAETVNIHDAAEDKKYFTMIPNMVVDTLTVNELALYMLMKRISGEHGTFSMGSRAVKKRLGMGFAAIAKAMTKLEELHYITFRGFQAVETDGGFQKVRGYTLNDVWHKNMASYQNENKGVPNEEHHEHKGAPTRERPRRNKDKKVGAPNRGAPNGERKKKDNSNKNSGSTLPGQARTPEFPGMLVNEIIDLFSSVNPSTDRLFRRIPQRDAVIRLLRKYGETKVRGMIGSLPEIMKQRGAPQITTPTQLEDKLGQLIIFYKQQNKTKEVIY